MYVLPHSVNVFALQIAHGVFCTETAITQMARPKVAITTALGELEASQGNLEEARRVFQEGLDRLATIPNPGQARNGKWIGPGRVARGWQEIAAEGPGEILITWAKLEEQVALYWVFFFKP